MAWTPKPFELGSITLTFRDVADRDYISARVLYRHDLETQFLWSALQAVEKYLKAILLYNGRDTRGLRHSLRRALDAVLKIDDIAFQFPDDLGPFLEYLDVYGPNRYLDLPHYTHGEELLQLDRCVWHIRRYCQYLRGEVELSTGEKRQLLPANLKSVHSQRFIDQPHRFRISNGFLENVLRDRDSPMRAQLVWKNLYYGARHRRHLGSFRVRMVSINPPHISEPGLFELLRERVDYPRWLEREFDEAAGRGRSRHRKHS
jgi:HEPN domain-containing protein